MPAQNPLWQQSDFLRLWAAQAISAVGARITREGLVFTAVMALGASPSQLGLLSALTYGPAMIVGLAGGGFVDSRTRRPILIAADLVRAGVLATLPLAAWLHLLSLLQVYAAAALVGAGSAIFDMADHAYLPGLVGRALVGEANARISTTESVAELGGPALAGTLFQWLTAPVAIGLNALTYLASALILMRIRTREAAPPRVKEAGGLLVAMAGGARIAWREPRVRPLLAMTGVSGLFGGVFGALYIAYVLRELALGPVLLGLGIATGGAGAVVGSLVAMPLSRRLGVGRTICLSGAASAFGTMLVLLTPRDHVIAMPVLMVSQFLGDAFGVIPMILVASLTQSLLPGAVLGRVRGAFQAITGAAMVTGALLGGLAGQAIGMRAAMLVAIAGLLTGPLLGALSPLRQVGEMPLGEDPEIEEET